MFRRASIGLATTVCMLMLAALSAYAIPAIDLDGRGVTVVRTADATSLDIRVKVIDFNSKEHTVTVTAPFGVDIPLQFESSQDDSYYYSGVYDLEGEDEIGNYVISAKNDSGESATAVDSIEKYKIEIPDSSSFSPSLVADSISANFSLIYINYVYQRYDTFTDNPWEFGDRWEAGSCMPVLFPSKRSASLVVADALGASACPLAFQNADDIDRIRTTIKLENVSSGNPNAKINARIAGHFFSNGNSRVWSKIEVFEDRVVCSAEEETEVDGLIGWNTIYEAVMLTGNFVGLELPLEIRLEGIDIFFQINFVDKPPIIRVFTPEDTITPILGGTKQLESRMDLVWPDTTPTFKWEAVKGASRYLLNIYNTGGDKVWEGYTGFEENTYRVPPGVLKPYSRYAYQLEAIESRSGFEIDHETSAPSEDNSIEFSVETIDSKPYIELDSAGVQTWNNAAGDPYLVFRILVHDPQGVPANIETVDVEFPDGSIKTLELISNPTSTTGVYYRFGDPLPEIEDDENDNEEPVYKFIVTDKDGNSFEVSEKLSVAPIDFPTNGTMMPAPYTVLAGTAAEFDWEDIPGAALYQLEIYNSEGKRIYQLNTTESSYSLAAGFLNAGENYEWKVNVLREFPDQNIDNGSSSASFPIATAPFRMKIKMGRPVSKPVMTSPQWILTRAMWRL